jgi:hypothetical protein
MQPNSCSYLFAPIFLPSLSDPLEGGICGFPRNGRAMLRKNPSSAAKSNMAGVGDRDGLGPCSLSNGQSITARFFVEERTKSNFPVLIALTWRP